MRLVFLAALLLCSANAFTLLPTSSRTVPSCAELFATGAPGTDFAKKNLVETAESLREEYGIFLIDKSAKEKLKSALESLESMTEPPSYSEDKDTFLGDWELVCTTAASDGGIDTSNIPFVNQGPLKEIRDTITKQVNKYLKVQQRIRSTDDADGEIDRIDHVIEYDPPSELQDVLEKLPDPLKSLNINPLQVSKSKLVLVHKAENTSDLPLKMKISLKSVILNVAGKSTVLDPNGKDVAAINVPLGEFLNAGDFETTYMDENLRVSRGKQGFVDQLRVFVREGKMETDAALRDIKESGKTVGKGVDAELDVDDAVDPEFDSEIEAPSDVEE